MKGNIYLDLTNEFNEGRLRAVLSSGQAVVMHKLAMASKDGDWIVREDEEALDFVLSVLEGHGATYRLGAPLDVSWMSGGWSAHFEFKAENYRARTDFVTRPPRLSPSDLAQMWDEQERGENGGLPVPTLDLRRLVALKKTDRERDYAVIGELARQMTVENQLLESRSARDLMELWKNYPQLVQSLASQRPLLAKIGSNRLELQRLLADEQFGWMERNEQRLRSYSRSAKPWSSFWPQLQKQIRELPLREAHEIVVKNAIQLLPFNPAEEGNV